MKSLEIGVLANGRAQKPRPVTCLYQTWLHIRVKWVGGAIFDACLPLRSKTTAQKQIVQRKEKIKEKKKKRAKEKEEKEKHKEKEKEKHGTRQQSPRDFTAIASVPGWLWRTEPQQQGLELRAALTRFAFAY